MTTVFGGGLPFDLRSGLRAIFGPKVRGNVFKKRADLTQIVAGAATDCVVISGLDGLSVEQYLFRYWIKNDDAPTARDFKLYPNELQGDSTGCAIATQTGASATSLQRDDLTVAANTTREFIQGWCMLYGAINPAASPSDFARRWEAFSTVNDDPVTAATSGFHRCNGAWGNVIANLTSVCFQATSPGLTTIQDAIGVDSVFEVWELNP